MTSNITKIIIIPGFGESASEDEYVQLKKNFQIHEDSVVEFYNPTWDRRTIRHWIEDFNKQFKDVDTSDFILIGFSLGAYIALALAKGQKFKKVMLASLSPYFKENLKQLPDDAVKFMGKNRMKDFADIAIPKFIDCPSVFLFGDKDWKMAISQAQKLAIKYNGKFFLIEDTGHELTKNYIKKITAEA